MEKVVDNLILQIERARKELDEAVAARKAAWDLSGWDKGHTAFACWNYHHHFQKWEAARDHLRALEEQLAQQKGAA